MNGENPNYNTTAQKVFARANGSQPGWSPYSASSGHSRQLAPSLSPASSLPTLIHLSHPGLVVLLDYPSQASDPTPPRLAGNQSPQQAHRSHPVSGYQGWQAGQFIPGTKAPRSQNDIWATRPGCHKGLLENRHIFKMKSTCGPALPGI